MLAISIDVGGTLTKCAVVDEAGQARYEWSEPTASSLPPAQVPDHVADLVRRLMAAGGLAASDLAGVCIGLPGIVEYRLGLALSCPNLRNWEGMPLADLVAERTGVKTWVERDANLAALGEAWVGAACGTDYSVCFTLGTGIGAGIILDGRLFRGAWGGAGEIGHITIARDGPRCACGNRGCLESLTSATAIAREAQAAADRAPESLLWSLARGQRGAITADLVFKAAGEGDPAAMRVVDTAVEYLGIGVANVINVFNLEVVVLAGGMAAAGSQILDPVREVVRQRARQPLVERSRVELSRLGARAGVLGGARLVHMGAN